MRTGGDDINNYSIWMIWQPSSTNARYVQLVSATNSIMKSAGYPPIYEMLASSDPEVYPYNTYSLNDISTSTPAIATNSLDQTVGTSSTWQFLMTKVRTTTFNGSTCDVVTFKLTYNGKYLDYTKAISNSNTSPTLETSTGANTQFVLEKILPHYDGLVAPTSVYLQTSPSGSSTKTVDWWTTNKLYPQWTESGNTIIANDYHYIVTSDITINNYGVATYGTGVTQKVTADDCITVSSKRWMKNPITIPSCSSTVKGAGKRFYIATIRDLTVFGKTFNFSSAGVTRDFKFAKKPTLTKDGLSWTPDGMKVNFTSDYFNQGSMKLRFTSVKSGATELLVSAYETSIIKDTTVTIPTENLKRPPTDGEDLTLTIRLDTDVYAPSTYYVTISDTLTYDEGTVDVTPTVTEIDGLRYTVDVPYANTVKVWLSADGKNTLLEGTVSNGHTIYEIIPAFLTEYGLFVSYENSDKTVWGTAYVDMPMIKIRAHAFTWSGGSVVIWLNKDEALQESFTFSPTSTTHTLAGRSHDVVTYLSDGTKNYTSVTGDIKGYIVPQVETYGTTRDSIEAMVEQGHVLYRAPYGRVCNVAVTGADITTDKGITEVSISIVEEDV